MPQRFPRLTVVLLSACLWTASLALTSPGRAQLFELRDQTRQLDAGHSALGLDFSLFAGRRSGQRQTLLAPYFLAAHRAGEVVLEAAMPLVYMRAATGGDAEATNVIQPGNLWLGAAYLPDVHCGLSRLSFGVGAPTARGSESTALAALASAAQLAGDWQRGLWASRVMPLVLGASSETRTGAIRWLAEGDATLGLPVGDGDLHYGLQLGGAMQIPIGRSLMLGGRLSGSLWSSAGGEVFQAAVSPFLRIMSQGEYLAVRLLINLDRPAGFAFDEAGIWGLHVNTGKRF